MGKKTSYAILAALFLAAAWYHEVVLYGFAQGYGQANVLWSTKPVAEVMANPEVSDSVKQKIAFINQIKQFAFDSLGITKNDNYTSFYDQKGKPILWVLTVCPPYELKAYEWSFPILGNFSYKGFFDYTNAIKEKEKFNALGYDTDLGEVSAWSTLGWFKDPILSSMLKKKPGNLASLIIHELTHGTLYIKDNVEFNENLANFIGDFGARKFMEVHYGKASAEYIEYEKSLDDNTAFAEHNLLWANKLDSLYRSFEVNLSKEKKQMLKDTLLAQAKASLSEFLAKMNALSARQQKALEALNNAYFIDYITYHARQNSFEEEFNTKFNANFNAYMAYLKERYPSM